MNQHKKSPRSSGGEPARRAEILRRYVAIDLPTIDDDVRYAGELGLSVDSLIRLASAWRRHGEDVPIQGSQTRLDQQSKAIALQALERGVALDGIAEHRRDKVARRLEILLDHLRMPQPERADVAASASAAGLTPNRFNKMLRAWVLHRDPMEIPGGRIPRRRWRRFPAELDRDERQLDRAIAELGPNVSGRRLHDRVVELCLAEGLTPPSLPTHYARLRARRAGD